MNSPPPGGTPPWQRTTDMKFNNEKKTLNRSPEPKFLLIKRTDAGKTMTGVSPFLINRCLKGQGGPPKKLNMLRNGSLLVQAKDVFQADKYIKIIAFSADVNVRKMV